MVDGGGGGGGMSWWDGGLRFAFSIKKGNNYDAGPGLSRTTTNQATRLCTVLVHTGAKAVRRSLRIEVPDVTDPLNVRKWPIHGLPAGPMLVQDDESTMPPSG